MSDRKYAISFFKANVVTLGILFPASALFVTLYGWLWSLESLMGIVVYFKEHLLAVIAVLILFTVAHETLHAISWIYFGKKKWSSIKFGFSFKGMAPYVHCREPMKVSAYRIGTAMPGLILGVLPLIAAFVSGSPGLFWFGFVFTISAGGDATVLWLLRSVPTGAKIKDHPNLVGCEIADEAQGS